MRKKFYRATAVCLLGAMGMTGVGAAAHAMPVASTNKVVTMNTSSPGLGSIAFTSDSTSHQAPARGTAVVSTATAEKNWIKEVIKLLQKHGKSLYDGAVKAAKQGWAAMKSWWNKLPGAAQWAINQVSGWSLWEFFNFLI